MKTIGKIRGVYAGKAVPFTRPGTFSAIDKQPVAGPVTVGTEGLQCDEQGDRRVHGGPDKAVHVYAWPNYAHWRTQFPDNRRFDAAPAFGENLSVEGVDETTVCLGDQWRVGTVQFEVSQGRQPCWKLNDRFGTADDLKALVTEVHKRGMSVSLTSSLHFVLKFPAGISWSMWLLIMSWLLPQLPTIHRSVLLI